MDTVTTTAGLELRRVIAAPREDVFRAWTEVEITLAAMIRLASVECNCKET